MVEKLAWAMVFNNLGSVPGERGLEIKKAKSVE